MVVDESTSDGRSFGKCRTFAPADRQCDVFRAPKAGETNGSLSKSTRRERGETAASVELIAGKTEYFDRVDETEFSKRKDVSSRRVNQPGIPLFSGVADESADSSRWEFVRFVFPERTFRERFFLADKFFLPSPSTSNSFWN